MTYVPWLTSYRKSPLHQKRPQERDHCDYRRYGDCDDQEGSSFAEVGATVGAWASGSSSGKRSDIGPSMDSPKGSELAL